MGINDVTVLICDDSIFVRRKMRSLLLSLGVREVFEASDGKKAVDEYKDKKPTVVFMDIIMPVMTGIEAVTEILKINPSAKVVMASSIGTQKYLKEAIDAGAYDFLQKPFVSEQVKKLINNVIRGDS